MKKIVLLLIGALAMTLNAQVYTEYFTETDPQADGTPGVALSPGDPIEVSDALTPPYWGWYLSAKSSNREVGPDGQASPLVTSEDALFYGDYIGDEMGQVVKIDSAVAYATDQRSSFWTVNDRKGDTLKMPASGLLYTAFLFQPQANSKNSHRDFFGYEWSATSNTSRGRVFMSLQGDDVIFGVSRNKTSPSDGLDTITIANAVNKTFLMVMKYEMGDPDVDMDDTVRLYINPDPLLSEEEQTGIVLSSKDPQSDRKEGAIVRLRLRQRGQNGLIGGIRVGTDWGDVLQGESVDVTGVSLDQESLALNTGASATLVASVMPEDATDPSVSWSSSDEAIATVADGVVTGVAPGTATITVTTTDGSFTAECAVTVSAVAVTGVTLDMETLTLDVGANATLVATVMPEDAADPSVSWSSSDEAIATVADGVVTGVAAGTATITVTTTDGSFTADCAVSVSTVGIAESSVAKLSLYPNPSTGAFTIDNFEGADVHIYNATGQLVFKKLNIANSQMIDANLTKGIYLVNVTLDKVPGFAKLIIE